jgi:hypothetical protein
MISGEIKQRERTRLLRPNSRRTGRFDYRVKLPDQVEAEKIDASLSDDVLTVRILGRYALQRHALDRTSRPQTAFDAPSSQSKNSLQRGHGRVYAPYAVARSTPVW